MSGINEWSREFSGMWDWYEDNRRVQCSQPPGHGGDFDAKKKWVHLVEVIGQPVTAVLGVLTYLLWLNILLQSITWAKSAYIIIIW